MTMSEHMIQVMCLRYLTHVQPDLQFLYGREDWTPPDPSTASRMMTEGEKALLYPKPHFTALETVRYFYQVFNLTVSANENLLPTT